MAREQKMLRIIQIVFIVFGALQFLNVHFMPSNVPTGPLTLFQEMVVVIAVLDNVIGIFLQRTLMKRPGRMPSVGKAATPAQRWLMANVFRLALSLSTCLFGLVLHMVGSQNWLAQSLIGLGVLFMVVVNPGNPPAVEPANSPYGDIG